MEHQVFQLELWSRNTVKKKILILIYCVVLYFIIEVPGSGPKITVALLTRRLFYFQCETEDGSRGGIIRDSLHNTVEGNVTFYYVGGGGSKKT